MQKRFLVSITLVAVLFVLLASQIYANTNDLDAIGNGLENLVTDAGNAINDGAMTIRNGVGDAEDGIENAVSDVFGDGNSTNSNSMSTGTTNENQGNADTMGGSTNYNATRTSTDDATFLGMTANGWTWLIMAILAVAIVALVWFYAKQRSDSYSNSSHE